MEELVEIVAEAIWRSDYEAAGGTFRGWTDWSKRHFMAADVFRGNARAAITAICGHDAQAAVLRCLGAITATPIHDPDDYRHPLSLVGGPRHERGGLKS